jgi:hypothetical protein
MRFIACGYWVAASRLETCFGEGRLESKNVGNDKVETQGTASVFSADICRPFRDLSVSGALFRRQTADGKSLSSLPGLNRILRIHLSSVFLSGQRQVHMVRSAHSGFLSLFNPWPQARPFR